MKKLPVLLLIVMSIHCFAATLTVNWDGSGDYTTIQAAINAAVSGVDTVIVAQGTYSENISLEGKAITLRSTDPNDPTVVASTIIDNPGASRVIVCASGETPETVISGFMITNGYPEYSVVGGGMYNYHSSPTTVDDLTPLKWSRIPHFYHSFYVYQYATSFAASQAILDKFLGGDDALIGKYLSMLRAGASDYPIELLKICGVDMTTPAPIEATLKLFAEQVAEVDRLTS